MKRLAVILSVVAAVVLLLALLRPTGEIVTVEPGRIERQVVARAIVAPEQGVAHVTGPPGVVREVRARVGDVVGRGVVLAVVDQQEVVAPIAGTVLAVHAAAGDNAAAPLFEMAYLGKLEVRIEVAAEEAAVIRRGQAVTLRPLGGGATIALVQVDHVAPVMGARTIGLSDARLRAEGRVQSVFASVPRGLIVGQELEAVLAFDAVEVPARLPHRAVRIVDGHAAVSIVGQVFDSTAAIRLGESDEHWVEVIDLAPGVRVRVPY